MSTHAEVAVDRRGDWVVARLTGEVDLTNAHLVREELTRTVPNDAAGLIVDLQDTRYLDSAAIEMVFEVATLVGHRRQKLALVAPPTSPLRRLLTLTGVEAMAAIHESVATAVAAGGTSA